MDIINERVWQSMTNWRYMLKMEGKGRKVQTTWDTLSLHRSHTSHFTLHTSHFTPHLHKVPCHHTFHTHFHCSHPPILSHHILLSDNFSTPHTLVCCVLFHVQVCDPYFSVGRRILFLKPLFISMDIFPLITFASDLMTHLPFTTLFCISPSIPLYFQILKLYHFIHSFCP